MSTDSTPASTAAWPKRKLRRSQKTILVCGALAGVSLVMCGATGYLSPIVRAALFAVGRHASQITADPAKSAEIAGTIFDGDFGESLRPTSLEIDVVFVGPFMKIVTYRDENRGETIVIGQADPTFAQTADPPKLQAQMRDAVNEHVSQGDVTTLITTPRQVTVRGQPANFTFAKVKNNDGKYKGTESRMASGPFQGKGGPAFIKAVVPATSYSEGELAQLIEKVQ